MPSPPAFLRQIDVHGLDPERPYSASDFDKNGNPKVARKADVGTSTETKGHDLVIDDIPPVEGPQNLTKTASVIKSKSSTRFAKKTSGKTQEKNESEQSQQAQKSVSDDDVEI